MTCIVGLVEDGRVVMGADSAGVGGYDLRTRADEKVFRRGPYLIGGTSSFRMLQLLRFRLAYPATRTYEGVEDRAEADFRYMATDFVDAVRDCLKAGGYARKKDDEESGGCFLVGYHGRLYRVESDYQVAAYHEPYAACGCGEGFALGALAGVREMSHSSVSPPPAHRQVELALEVAERFSAGVRRPFVIKTLEAS